MKLLTKSIQESLPPIGTDDTDPMVWVKFFCPWSSCGIEYDPVDLIFFGYVEGLENELGDFSLDELEKLQGPLGLKIERDLHFKPKRLSEIKR